MEIRVSTAPEISPQPRKSTPGTNLSTRSGYEISVTGSTFSTST